MKHRMAIWANWSKVRDRVEFVFPIHQRKWFQMVNVDETLSKRTVSRFEVEPAYAALEAVLVQASLETPRGQNTTSAEVSLPIREQPQ